MHLFIAIFVKLLLFICLYAIFCDSDNYIIYRKFKYYML